MPGRVHFENGAKIEYKYDASGGKHEVKHTKPGITDLTTAYLSNKIYENGNLKMILTEDGYVTKQGSTYNYYFYLKDRLGNNRVVIDRSGNVKQVTNYYPFGASFAEYPRRNDQEVQPYKFGDKELDRMYGLDMYDFHARQYDPVLGRFTTMDPLA